MNRARRVVVTGLGICVSNGRNISEFGASLFGGNSGIREVTDFDVFDYRNGQAGVVVGVDPEEHSLPPDIDRASLFAMVSAAEAVADAGLVIEGDLRYRTGVTVGTSLGGMLAHVRAMRQEHRHDPDTQFEGPYDDVLDIPPCQIAKLLSDRFGARAGNATAVTACAAGSNSIAIGIDMIRSARADVVLAAAADPLSELSYSGFNILMALSRNLSRPFDRNREGLVIGEGGGALILEDLEHAQNRDARIRGEIIGYGLSNDAHHPTQPDPAAGGACRAIRRALEDSELQSDEIDYINAHGTSTRYNDLMELKAVATVYGDQAPRIPISSIKAMIGHTLGAAGTIEAIATILSLESRYLPPTINFQTPMEEYPWDFVPVGRRDENLVNACSHSFGFGGNAACLVMRRWPDSDEAVRRAWPGQLPASAGPATAGTGG